MLAFLAVGLPTFCIWLVVRIVNRRERWAKWTMGALIAGSVLYVASFGLAVHTLRSGWISERAFFVLYDSAVSFVMHCPSELRTPIFWVWTECGASDIELFFLLHPH